MPLYVYSISVSYIEVHIQHSNVSKASKNLDIKQFKSRDDAFSVYIPSDMHLNLGKLQPSNMRLESLMQGERLLTVCKSTAQGAANMLGSMCFEELHL